MMVTPIGICLSYYEQSNNFIFVVFNKERVKLYDNGKLTVTDAAMQMQFPNEDLFPKRGKALLFSVNGKSRMMRGTPGEACVIMVNGDPADMYTQIHNGDRITVTPSTAGEPASLELGKLPELSEYLHIYVNGQKIDLPKTAKVNGISQNEFYQIQEGDDIEITNSYTIREVAVFLDVPLGEVIRVNDMPAQADTKVYENFTVSWDMSEETEADEDEEWNYITDDEAEYEEAVTEEPEQDVSDEESWEEETKEKAKEETGVGTVKETVGRDVKFTRSMMVIVNHLPITLQGKANYVFVDVFDYIDFDLSASRGRGIVTQINGRQAEYMESLKDGDVIDIYWKELNK